MRNSTTVVIDDPAGSRTSVCQSVSLSVTWHRVASLRKQLQALSLCKYGLTDRGPAWGKDSG